MRWWKIQYTLHEPKTVYDCMIYGEWLCNYASVLITTIIISSTYSLSALPYIVYGLVIDKETRFVLSDNNVII